MAELNETKIWKIRTIKNYPEAHNHLLVGRVLEITDSYVRMHCRTFHFGKVVDGPRDIEIGDLMVRVVPWSRIEIINELPPAFNYAKTMVIADKEGEVLFQDTQYKCPLVSGQEQRYQR